MSETTWPGNALWFKLIEEFSKQGMEKVSLKIKFGFIEIDSIVALCFLKQSYTYWFSLQTTVVLFNYCYKGFDFLAQKSV